MTPSPDFPPIFVISLAHAVNRRATISARLNALGLKYEIVNAVDGKSADPAAYRRQLRQDIARRKWSRELSPAEIGCYLSHYNLWRCIAAEEIPRALVLEDDADLTADFIPVVTDVLTLNCNWGIVHLAARHTEKVDVALRGLAGRDYVFGRYKRRLMLTHAYLISLTGARKLLDICREISEPIDHAWGHWWRTGLVFYCVAPELARQTAPESTIGDRHPKIGKLTDRITGSIWRRWDRISCLRYRLTHPLPEITRRDGVTEE